MNILQYFHEKEILPPFKVGDKIRLRHDPLTILPLYNREYPNCFCSENKWIKVFDNLANERLGWGEHVVSKITKGTPASGGWFVYVDGLNRGYHGNIFELI